MEIEIAAPVPSPGMAVVNAVQGGVIESFQGDVKLSVAAGSLPADTAITVEQLDPDVLTISSDDAYNHAVVRVTVEPPGVQFSEPVGITLPLRYWVEPGTPLPLFLLDENMGMLEDAGISAAVDASGLRAIASVNHFSTYVLRQPYSMAQLAVRQTIKEILQSPSFVLPEFEVTLAPDMPLMEGLSIPVLVKKREGLPSGIGPFAAPSWMSVSVGIAGYAATDTPAYAGPIIQSNFDGWELGTVINIGTLPDCGEGETKRGYLNISYAKGGSTQELSLPFNIQCLDELVFSGSAPPSFVPSEPPLTQVGYFDYKGLRVRVDEQGKYIVYMLDPGQTYRFSKVDIGTEGVLMVQPYLPPTGVTAPYILEVTGDVRVAGKISLAGAPGNYGFRGAYSCGDCGGEGGRGVALNSGQGGHGGPFNGASGDACVPLSCPNYTCFNFYGLIISRCNGGHDGQGALIIPLQRRPRGTSLGKEDIPGSDC